MGRGSGRETGEDTLGDEWSDAAAFQACVDEYILQRCRPDMVVAEIGSGGGRVAKLVLPRVKELHCFDISAKMLERCEAELASLVRDSEGGKKAHFHLLDESCALPA